MKKFILFAAALFLFSLASFAQGKHDKGLDPKMMKEIQDFKVKFLAQEMELDDAQKTKFADLYNKMCEEKRKNFDALRALEKKLKETPEASEEAYEEVSDKILSARVRDAEIEREYDAKFAKFLTKKQIYKMKEAENTFRHKMRAMHKKHKDNKKDNTKGSKGRGK